jgi:hypothetical protein
MKRSLHATHEMPNPRKAYPSKMSDLALVHPSAWKERSSKS